MKLEYIDTVTNIDYEPIDIYETETGYRYRNGNFISKEFGSYDSIVRFLYRRGYRF